jgi:hypothetical protein
MPLAEKGVRGKGRQPLSPPSAVETGAPRSLTGICQDPPTDAIHPPGVS